VALALSWLVVAFQGNLGTVTAIPGRSLVFLLLSGCATGASWLFYFRALHSGPVGLVSAVDRSSLAITLVLAAIFLGETLTLRTAIGCGLMLAGVAVVAWP
jgi:transporter family protein